MPAFGTIAIRDMLEEMRDISDQLLLKWERCVITINIHSILLDHASQFRPRDNHKSERGLYKSYFGHTCIVFNVIPVRSSKQDSYPRFLTEMSTRLNSFYTVRVVYLFHYSFTHLVV
jgi:hypothetical protein